MSIINTALIGKLKKTKADKTNVLQKDNTESYTPGLDYHPSTKKYVDDNKLKSIVDNPLVALYDGRQWAVVNDLSSVIGASTTMITKNYDRSLFLQDQSLILEDTGNFTLPITIETWVYYNDNVPSLTNIFEVGGALAGGGQQSISAHADGSVYYTDVDGGSGITGSPSTAFVPQNGWVHYAMYVSETSYALWINGSRKLNGTLGVWPGNGHNYAQTVPRTYFAYGTKNSTAPNLSPNCIYDSVRISNGDIYGASNTSIVVPSFFPSEGSTRSVYFLNTVYDANVVNAMFINAPTAPNNPATKQYVDNGIIVNGNVQGNTLSLNKNDGSAIHINVSSLLDDTTNTVSSGVLNGNVITFTRQDGSTFEVNVSNLYDDTNLVTSVNGQTGSVEVPLLSSVSFNSSTNVLTTNRSDGVSYTADLSSLAQNYYVNSAELNGPILTLGRTGGLSNLDVDLTPIIASNTDVVAEGANNLYYTDARARNALSVVTGVFSPIDFTPVITYTNGTDIVIGGNNSTISPLFLDIYLVPVPSFTAKFSVGSVFKLNANNKSAIFEVTSVTLINDTDAQVSLKLLTGDQTVIQEDLTVTGASFTFGTAAHAKSTLTYDNATGVFTFTADDLSRKQDVLVSGDSIKTINGQSLLGSGNIEITANGIDKYVTSGSVSGGTLTLTNNDATTININVSSLLDDTTNTVSSGVLSGNNIVFTRQDGSTFQVDVSSLYDDTNLVTSVNGQTGDITINDANNYVDSVSLNGNVLRLTRTGALPDLTVDLSSLITIDTDNYVDSATLNGNILTLGRSGSLADLTVDLSSLITVDTDNYVDSAVLNGNILTLGRSGSLPDLTVDLSSLGGGTGGTTNINVFSRREKQDFTAQAGQTQFVTTLDLIDVEVFYNGFKLDEEDYTTSNGVVTLLEAAQVGDNIEVIDYGSQDLTGETFVTSSIAPSTPALGTVWQDTSSVTPIIKIWNGSNWVVIGDIEAAYNKFTFDVTTQTSSFNAVYTVGFVEVFFNGLKLTESEYIATNGTSVTLTTPAENGDYVEIIALNAITSASYYNKTEVDTLIGNIDLSNYYTKTQVDTIVGNIDLSNYYTKAEVDQMIAGAGTGSSTTTGTTTQVVDSFDVIDYRSGEYFLTITGTSGFMALKMLVLFNGSSALNTQYAQIGSDLGLFDTLYHDGQVDIIFTPTDSTATVQFSRTLIENLGGSTPSVTLPSDLNSGTGTIDLNSGSGTIDLNGTIIGGDLQLGSGTIDLLAGSGTTDLNQ